MIALFLDSAVAKSSFQNSEKLWKRNCSMQ